MLGEETKNDYQNIITIPRVSSQEHRDEHILGNKIVVIDNYTNWCGPCKQITPQFANLASKYMYPNICSFLKENVEDNIPGVPVRIRGVPCFHFYKNGIFLSNMTVTGGNLRNVENNLKILLNKEED